MEQLGCLKVRRDTGEVVEILTKTRADNVCMCDGSGKKLDEVLADINKGLSEAGKKQTVSVAEIDGVTHLVITEADGTQTKTPLVTEGQTVEIIEIDGVQNLVITDVDGTQTKTPIVGGGGESIFTISVTRDANNKYVIDKTFDEIQTAYENNEGMILQADGFIHQLIERSYSSTDGKWSGLRFVRIYTNGMNDTQLRMSMYYVSRDNVSSNLWTYNFDKTPDSHLSETSTNAVQNMVVAQKFTELEENISSEFENVTNRIQSIESGMSGGVVILPETELIQTDENMFGYTDAIIGVNIGETYTINYNGVPYECTALPFDMQGMAFTALGNNGFITSGEPDDSYPFVVLLVPQEAVEMLGMGMIVQVLDAPTSVTLSISGASGGTSWNDLTDKPFYSEGGEVVEIVPETLFEGVTEDGLTLSTDYRFSVGETYTITYNGVTYECVGFDLSFAYPNGVGFGNWASDGLGGNGEPFMGIYAEMDGQVMLAFINIDGLTSFTLSMSVKGAETIHKLDNKFLDLEWLPVMNPIFSEIFRGESLHFSSSGYHDFNELPFEIVEGESYKVSFDGESYKVVGKTTEWAITDDLVVPRYYIGNLHIEDSNAADTGEPFVYSYATIGGANDAMRLKADSDLYGDADASFIVEGVSGREPNKIPVEFLPTGIGGVTKYYISATSETLYSDEACTKAVTKAELKEACYSGAVLVENQPTGDWRETFVPAQYYHAGSSGVSHVAIVSKDPTNNALRLVEYYTAG